MRTLSEMQSVSATSALPDGPDRGYLGLQRQQVAGANPSSSANYSGPTPGVGSSIRSASAGSGGSAGSGAIYSEDDIYDSEDEDEAPQAASQAVVPPPAPAAPVQRVLNVVPREAEAYMSPPSPPALQPQQPVRQQLQPPMPQPILPPQVANAGGRLPENCLPDGPPPPSQPSYHGADDEYEDDAIIQESEDGEGQRAGGNLDESAGGADSADMTGTSTAMASASAQRMAVMDLYKPAKPQSVIPDEHLRTMKETEEESLKKCTFAPQISKKSEQIASIARQGGQNIYEKLGGKEEIERHKKLLEEAAKDAEKDTLAECFFSPYYNEKGKAKPPGKRSKKEVKETITRLQSDIKERETRKQALQEQIDMERGKPPAHKISKRRAKEMLTRLYYEPLSKPPQPLPDDTVMTSVDEPKPKITMTPQILDRLYHNPTRPVVLGRLQAMSNERFVQEHPFRPKIDERARQMRTQYDQPLQSRKAYEARIAEEEARIAAEQARNPEMVGLQDQVKAYSKTITRMQHEFNRMQSLLQRIRTERNNEIQVWNQEMRQLQAAAPPQPQVVRSASPAVTARQSGRPPLVYGDRYQQTLQAQPPVRESDAQLAQAARRARSAGPAAAAVAPAAAAAPVPQRLPVARPTAATIARIRAVEQRKQERADVEALLSDSAHVDVEDYNWRSSLRNEGEVAERPATARPDYSRQNTKSYVMGSTRRFLTDDAEPESAAAYLLQRRNPDLKPADIEAVTATQSSSRSRSQPLQPRADAFLDSDLAFQLPSPPKRSSGSSPRPYAPLAEEDRLFRVSRPDLGSRYASSPAHPASSAEPYIGPITAALRSYSPRLGGYSNVGAAGLGYGVPSYVPRPVNVYYP